MPPNIKHIVERRKTPHFPPRLSMLCFLRTCSEKSAPAEPYGSIPNSSGRSRTHMNMIRLTSVTNIACVAKLAEMLVVSMICVTMGGNTIMLIPDPAEQIPIAVLRRLLNQPRIKTAIGIIEPRPYPRPLSSDAIIYIHTVSENVYNHQAAAVMPQANVKPARKEIRR